MRKANWVVYAAALGMMVVTAGWLKDFQGRHLLGPPGVRVSPVPIYDEATNMVSTQSVVLPTNVLGIPAWPHWTCPITISEERTLPKDTTFGRGYYRASGSDFGVQISVVLMGTDHTSIHQPQYCLYAQGWTVTQTERISLHVERPFAYDIPAIKLTATRQLPKSGQMITGIYIYWFVSGDKITAEESSRLLSMWKTMLKKGELERWAYISYFATCIPEREQATFERLEKFIQASAPEFQLVTGSPAGRLPLQAQK